VKSYAEAEPEAARRAACIAEIQIRAINATRARQVSPSLSVFLSFSFRSFARFGNYLDRLDPAIPGQIRLLYYIKLTRAAFLTVIPRVYARVSGDAFIGSGKAVL